MKSSAKLRSTPRSLDLIEQAVHLLRAAPISCLAIYYLGALPFILGLLYFWTDMARSPFAYQHLAGSALGLSGLFLWMKFCQAVFARKLRSLLSAEGPSAERPNADVSARSNAPRSDTLTPAQLARIFMAQAILQPTALFLLPLAALPALPLPWLYAFYQNVTAVADGESAEIGAVIKKSFKLAALWPKQNILMLGIMAAFGLYIFLNWTTIGVLVPALFKTLFGIESVFTRSGLGMLNTTFFAIMLGLSFLSIDPILKTIYVLRCFYGESLQSGEDLKAELKQFAAPALAGAGFVVLMIIFLGSFEIAGIPEPHPGGMPENSPTFQRWDRRRTGISPEGTADGSGTDWNLGREFNRPFGTYPSSPLVPTLKRWSIIACPYGTDDSPFPIGWQRVGVRSPSVHGLNANMYWNEEAQNRGGGGERGRGGGVVEGQGEAQVKGKPAGAASGGTGKETISPPELDRALREVIQREKYTWRAPRKKLESDSEQKGFLARFLGRVGQMLRRWVRAVSDWLGKLFRSNRPEAKHDSGYGWILSLHMLIYVLIAAVLSAVVIVLFRLWRNRLPQPVVASEAIQPALDLTDEHLGADQLPEDGWIKLARDLMSRGELRLAMRAFYLASLAHLAERNLITLAKFKSNRDYQRELGRRGHSLPELLSRFGENVSVFDRVWYGSHDITSDLLGQFAANVETISKGNPAASQPAV